MENNNNKPKLRFPGFTEPWEQRKLKDIASSTHGGGTPPTSVEEYWNGNIPWIQSSDLTENQVSGVSPRKYISEAGLRNSATKLVPENSIAIITRVGVGKLAFMPFSYTTSQDFLSLSYLNIDPWFGVYACYKKLQGELHAVQGTSIKGITKDDLLEKSIVVPCMNEQKRIGTFFKSLDNLITLHQRKLNHLQDKKKSLLQKMFPQNGEDFPELRFPGFTDAWEQRKLKQLAHFAKGQGYSKNDLTDVGTPIILYGRLYTKYQSTISEIDTFAVPQSGSVYSTGDEVIVPASGETAEDIARASAIVKSGFLLGGDLNIIYPNKDISTIFLALSISNGKQQKELSKKAQGKSVVHLHNSDLEEVTIAFPCREEQERIGSIFAHIDNLITLHQRKLDHLKEQKKALLQQMFI